ncbi:MAG: hypothetical protein KF838_08580 [Phycisphaeraceae bacterium]|nr:MAG: hypothetical protein KF838_08580 [Phycisphaeraceae bacterium]
MWRLNRFGASGLKRVCAAAFVTSFIATHVLAIQPTDAGEVIAMARKGYASAPFADRIDVEVIDGMGRRERSRLLVRVNPAGEGVASLLIEFPGMSVWADERGVLVVGSREASGWWESERVEEGPVASLRAVLPPIVAPTVAILSGEAAWTPATPEIRWNGLAEDSTGAFWVLGGMSGDLAVQATFDRGSSRLVRLVVSGPSGGPLAMLTVTLEPIEAGELTGWKPRTQGLERRATLAAVVDRRPTIVPGDLFPSVGWVRSDGRSWVLNEDLWTKPVSANSRNGIGVAVVTMFRASGDQASLSASLRDVRKGAEICRSVLRERLRSRVVSGETRPGSEVVLLPAAIFGGVGFSASRYEAITSEIGDLGPDGVGIVWSTPERRTIDAVAPGARAAMCIVDRAGRLHKVVVLDDLEDRINEAQVEIRDAISEALGER